MMHSGDFKTPRRRASKFLVAVTLLRRLLIIPDAQNWTKLDMVFKSV